MDDYIEDQTDAHNWRLLQMIAYLRDPDSRDNFAAKFGLLADEMAVGCGLDPADLDEPSASACMLPRSELQIPPEYKGRLELARKSFDWRN